MIGLRVGLLVGLSTGILFASSAVAQKVPYHKEATELFEALQDMESMTEVGFTALTYPDEARKIKVKLDRFMRSRNADTYPAGVFLYQSADSYIRAADSIQPRQRSLLDRSTHSVLENSRKQVLQIQWKTASDFLRLAETCLSGKPKSCWTLKDYEAKLGKKIGD